MCQTSQFFTLFWHLCVIIFHHVKLLPIWEIKITSKKIIITTIFFPLCSPKLCGVLISKNTNNPILGFKRWNCSHRQHGGKSHKLLSVVRIRVKTTLFFFSPQLQQKHHLHVQQCQQTIYFGICPLNIVLSLSFM